jgi:hypothetical protein
MSETDPAASAAPPGSVAALADLPALGRVERRILGVLVEKALTTPDQYPLTMNALQSGCNQKSNRDPVVEYDADRLDSALTALLKLGLVLRVVPATGRTDRWRHQVKEAWGLDKPQRAILAELFLRGPQSEGDIRGRASRMADLATLDDARRVLQELAAKGLVRRLSPEGRVRGVIWAHQFHRPDELTGTLAEIAAAGDDAPAGPAPNRSAGSDERRPSGADAPRSTSEPVRPATSPETLRRLDELTEAVAGLRAELEDLRAEVSRMRG